MTRRNSRHEPKEVAYLLNPAFVSLVLAKAVTSYEKEKPAGMPFIYAPVVSTISLYPMARSSLTMNTRTKFAVWIDRNPQIQIALAPRMAGMMAIVNEAILFGLHYKILEFNEGNLRIGSEKADRKIESASADIKEIEKSASYLGRWLAGMNSPATVCAMLGVTP